MLLKLKQIKLKDKFFSVKLLLLISLFFVFNHSYSQLYVNEVSQGTGGVPPNEYVELIVVGSPTCSDTCFDIRGWILDDNNGFFGSSGIAAGHIRFPNIPQWECVPYGSIILIYNNSAPYPGIVIDETDANNDLIYALPVNSNFLESNSTLPANGVPSTSYAGATYTLGGGDWNMLAMKNTGDLIQVVSPANLGTSFSSVGWGTNVSGTNYYTPGSTANLTLYMSNSTDDNPLNSSNWTDGGAAAAATSTPGYANSIANGTWVNNMRLRNFTPITSDTLKLCLGDSIFINGSWIKNNTMITTTFSTIGGCDSVVENNIVFLNLSQHTYDTVKLCYNDSVLINGNWIKTDYTYIDTFSTANCDSIVSHSIVFGTNKQLDIIGNEKLCVGTKGVLFVENNFNSYLWNTGSNSYLINIKEEGEYSITATDNEGCVFTDVLLVESEDCYNVCIPFVSNSFTPNGDGINDKFSPSFSAACDMVEYEFGIYNKWGKEIFSSIETADYWDGNINGKKAALGLYIWKLKYRLVDEIEYHEKIGVITIVQ